MLEELERITCEEALDRYCEELDEYIQEAYWDGDASENRMVELLEQWALADGLEIAWQPGDGRTVYSVYRYSEKGLS